MRRCSGLLLGADWWLLGYRGWSHIENGSVSLGCEMVERSLALRRDNANAAHALAHAMFEQGASDAAESFVAVWLPGYDRAGWLHAHLSWHQALAALERGEAGRALAIYRERIAPEAASAGPMPVLADAVSLLWRLGLYGHAVPRETWNDAAAFASRHFPGSGLAFADLHMALVAAATGDRAGLAARIGDLERRLAAGSLPPGRLLRSSAAPSRRSPTATTPAARGCCCRRCRTRCALAAAVPSAR